MKFIKWIIILFISTPIYSQSLMSNGIRQIEYLIHINDLDRAEIKIDSLDKTNQRDKFKRNSLKLKYEILYLKALLDDRKEKDPPIILSQLLDIKDDIQKNEWYELSYKTDLLIALSYEKAENLDLTNKYLNSALNTCKTHQLIDIYSTYCIRRSSYFRFKKDIDSSIFYAREANKYAEIYSREQDLMDSHILLGFYASQNEDFDEALKHLFILLNYHKSQNDSLTTSIDFNSIAFHYLKKGANKTALIYSDSAYFYKPKSEALEYDFYLPKVRSNIFDSLQRVDSAYFYYVEFHKQFAKKVEKDNSLRSIELEKEYEANKKEAELRIKNQQILLILILLIVISLAIILLFFQFRKINSQNKIIRNQVSDLSINLKQKKFLLSELQHRVKNNLQHVISILEIQKESVDFNNIDELIRATQNRVHSMALLHKKLKLNEEVNTVDLGKYIQDLSELVKDSYSNTHVKVKLNVSCNLETLSIDKASTLGLILVELVSNSMKHAFKNKPIGIINIRIESTTDQFTLYYSDNGDGFDFSASSSKGIGQEIIKGLIDQLGGKISTSYEHGFELMVTMNM